MLQSYLRAAVAASHSGWVAEITKRDDKLKNLPPPLTGDSATDQALFELAAVLAEIAGHVVGRSAAKMESQSSEGKQDDR